MIGMELTDKDGSPNEALTSRVKAKALDKNLLLLTCGNRHNVVRFIAPLIVSEKEIDIAVEIIDGIFREE